MRKIELSDDYNEHSFYSSFIGLPVIKKSKRPFKDTKRVNVPIDIIRNPHTNKLAFMFSEDSYVVCRQCELYVNEKL